jgi:hypothetical protein
VLEEDVFETLEHARVFRGRVLRDAEAADEGGVQGADGNSGESGGVVGEVPDTSARCRMMAANGRMQRCRTADDGRDARLRARG